jgi:hypothetical protein
MLPQVSHGHYDKSLNIRRIQHYGAKIIERADIADGFDYQWQ